MGNEATGGSSSSNDNSTTESPSKEKENQETDSSDSLPVHLIDKTYKIKSNVVGEGGYGSIRLGENILTKERVAIKYEDEFSKEKAQLEREYNVYKKLGTGIPGLPKVSQPLRMS